MNRIIREFDRAHPGLRSKLNKLLNQELKLLKKIGFPEHNNLPNIITMRLIKIIVEDG